MLKFAIASVSAQTNTQSAVSTFRHGATQNYIIYIFTLAAWDWIAACGPSEVWTGA